jgi:hypothetical protein
VELFVEDGKLRVGSWQLQAPVRCTITDLQQPSNPKKKLKKQKKKKKKKIPQEFRMMAAGILPPTSFLGRIQNTVNYDWLVGRDIKQPASIN